VSAGVVAPPVAEVNETAGLRRNHPYRPSNWASKPGTGVPPEYWLELRDNECVPSSTRLVLYDEDTVEAIGSTLNGDMPGEEKLSSGTATPASPAGVSATV
jgi:hypothetical protein